MVNPKLKDELNDQLCEAMLSLETVDECYQFFEDLCTISELKAMSQRLEVAPGVPGRNARPVFPSVSLSVYQLYALRSPLFHY